MILSGGQGVELTTLSMGESTPFYGDTTFYASSGLQLSGLSASYAHLFKTQPWVATLVNKLSRGTARLPMGTFDLGGTSAERADDTAYGELLRKPNPLLGYVGLWTWTVAMYDLYGEALWLKLRDDAGRVRELHPMHPANVLTRVIDGELYYGFVTGSASNLRGVWPAKDVVHFKTFHPETQLRGLSPCEPLRQTLLSEDAMRRTQTAQWRNGARAGVVLSHPKNLSDGAAKRLKAAWDAMHAGVDNAGKTAVLEEGLTPHLMQITAEDMQYIEGRKLNREECCAVWDVPPPAVHILDRATFSNITEQLRSLYRDTHGSRLPVFENVLATQLAPDFDPSGQLRGRFLLDEVLDADREKRAEADAREIQSGQSTINEIRRRQGKPAIDGGDELLVNAALVPLAALTVYEQLMLPRARQAASSDGKGLSAADARTINGRLGDVDHAADVDVDLLLTGLSSDTTHVRSLVRAAAMRTTPMAVLRKQITAAVGEPVTDVDRVALELGDADHLEEQA